MKALELTGKKFGKLTLIREAPKRGKHRMWLVSCDCGAFPFNAYQTNLTKGHTTSCGCHLREVVSGMFSTHKLSKTSMYVRWSKIKGRCNNKNCPSYKNYGGRGITICDRWLVFENFLTDLGQPPFAGASLDRIDNDKGYEPGNIRWADAKTQTRNKRNNVTITYRGITKVFSDWAKFFNRQPNSFRKYYLYWKDKGKSTEEIFGVFDGKTNASLGVRGKISHKVANYGDY